jgi:hypothetical protein
MLDDIYPDVKGNIQLDITDSGIIQKENTGHIFLEPIIKNTRKKVQFQKPAAPFRCGAVDFQIECEGIKKKAHVITRQAKHLSGENKNWLGICEAHGRWFNMQPLKVWYRFVKKRHPDRFNFLVKKAHFIMAQTAAFLEVDTEDENQDFGIIALTRPADVCGCVCHTNYPDWWCLNCISIHQPQKTL